MARTLEQIVALQDAIQSAQLRLLETGKSTDVDTGATRIRVTKETLKDTDDYYWSLEAERKRLLNSTNTTHTIL